MSNYVSAAAAAAKPISIPTSSAMSTSPGPHASFAPEAVSHKPNQHSPPRAKSPMPPTASLTDAGLTLMNDGANDAATSSSGGAAAQGNGETHGISPSYRAQDHQASSSLPIPSPPAEVEATLSKLTSHANVAGVLVLSRPEALVIRSGGAFFDPSGPGASDRAVRLKAVVEMVRNTVHGLERDVPKTEMGDELSFLRIRTKKYEMMISPSEKYLLVVIQDPTL